MYMLMPDTHFWGVFFFNLGGVRFCILFSYNGEQIKIKDMLSGILHLIVSTINFVHAFVSF